MRMRGIVTALAMTIVATPALAATRVPHDSWGKAGVSLDQYRADAAACTAQGYFKDISHTEAAQAFVRGSRELEAATQSNYQVSPGADATSSALLYAGQMQAIIHSVRPDQRRAEIHEIQQADVDHCLIVHGYRRFHLSDDQRKALSKLAIGSSERRTYLYRLASDPAVLRDQARWYVAAAPR
jgi:hypothetical protein